MFRSYISVFLALFTLAFVLGSCSKKMSSDNPLPTVYSPSIFISSDNQFVYAFDPTNGNKHWEYNVGDVVIASPLLYNEMLYVSTLNGVVFKLDARTGALVSKIYIPSQLIATPIADNNLVYFGSTNDTLYAVDTGSGKVKWKYGTHGQIQSSPTIHSGFVIFASYDGSVYSLSEATGVVNWTFKANPVDSFYSSPAIGYGTSDSASHTVTTYFVYIGGLSGIMYEINAATGALRWQYQTQAAIQSSPTAYGGNCIFGSNDYRVYCVDTQSGKPRWVDSTFDKVVSSPFADPVNQIIFVGSYDYKVYAMNIINGTLKWHFTSPVGALFKSSPIVYNGIMYIGGYDKYLYAFNPVTGAVIWKQNINGVIECSPVIDDLSGKSYNSSVSGYSN